MQTIRTIGHSTRSAEELIEILAAHTVNWLIDVRTIPKSRHNPQFNRDTIKGKLAQSKQSDGTAITLTDAEWETVGQSMSDKSWKDEYVGTRPSLDLSPGDRGHASERRKHLRQ